MITKDHKVMITGGATGIGFALAKKFHQAGNQVILVGRREGLLREASDRLPGSQIAVADISQASDRQRLVDTYPDLTILINNAGIQINQPLVEQEPATIMGELDVNLTAPILLTRAFLPHLLKQEVAAIVNVSSGLALVPKEIASIYCASKAGLHSFSKTLRWQLERTPVRVFELLPPLVDTDMTAGRGSGKLSPEALAEEFWRAFERDKFIVLGGKTKILALLHRFLPSLADRIMRKGL